MSAPKPREIKNLCKDIQNLASVVNIEYDWVWHAAYDRTVREQVRVSGGGGDEDAPVYADPTGDIVWSKARMRKALERQQRELRSIESQLREIENQLHSALERTEPRETFGDRRAPRSASPEDIRNSHEAQARRRERGEVTA